MDEERKAPLSPVGCAWMLGGAIIMAALAVYVWLGICYALAWMAGNTNHMHLMWFAIVAVWPGAFAGLFVGFWAYKGLVKWLTRRQEVRGFPVIQCGGVDEADEPPGRRG